LGVRLVFVTKYRRCLLDGQAIERLRLIFSKVCSDFAAVLVQLDGEGNHVHLLVNYPPKVSVSSLVNSLKGVSSYVLRRQLPRIAKCYWKNVLWSPSYFAASCGGAPLDGIKRYIEQQATPLESRLTPAGSPGLTPLTGGQVGWCNFFLEEPFLRYRTWSAAASTTSSP